MKLHANLKGWKANVFSVGFGIIYGKPKGFNVLGLMLGYLDIDLVW